MLRYIMDVYTSYTIGITKKHDFLSLDWTHIGTLRAKLNRQKFNILTSNVFTQTQIDEMHVSVERMLQNDVCPIQDPLPALSSLFCRLGTHWLRGP